MFAQVGKCPNIQDYDQSLRMWSYVQCSFNYITLGNPPAISFHLMTITAKKKNLIAWVDGATGFFGVLIKSLHESDSEQCSKQM